MLCNNVYLAFFFRIFIMCSACVSICRCVHDTCLVDVGFVVNAIKIIDRDHKINLLLSGACSQCLGIL